MNKVKKFKEFLGPEVWGLFIFSCALGLFLFFIESSFVYVIQGFFLSIGLVTKDQTQVPSWFPLSGNFPIYMLLVFGVLRGIFYMLKQYVGGLVSQAFMEKHRKNIVAVALRNAENYNSSEVINVFSERVAQAGAVLQSMSQVFLVGVSAFFLFLFGMKLAPKEMFFSIVLCAFFLFPLRFLNKYISQSGVKTRHQSDMTINILTVGLKHNFLLKIYDLVEETIQEAKKYISSYRNFYQKYYLVSSVRSYTPNVVGVMVLCGVSFYSKSFSKNLSPLQFISFFYLFMRFAQAMSDINTNLSEIKLHYGAFTQTLHWHGQINQELARERENQVNSQKAFEVNDISVSDLAFGYERSTNLFSGMNFRIGLGDCLLIKGKSGAGKSSLLKLITGIEKPSAGHVFINGQDINKNNIKINKVIGYVGPEPYIIHATIRENLLFGQHDMNVTDEEMFKILEFVHLHGEIKNLNFEINDLTGLSTGQKQRLSLARALLRKPRILILDEATANLDSMTESKIIEDLKKISKKLILIIVSHKSTFDEMATTTIQL